MSNELNMPTDTTTLRPWERNLFWYVLAVTTTIHAVLAPFYLPWWVCTLLILAAICSILMTLIVVAGPSFFRSIFEEYEDLYDRPASEVVLYFPPPSPQESDKEDLPREP